MESGNETPLEYDRVPETQFPEDSDRFQLTLASDPYSMLDTEVLVDLFFSPTGMGRLESPALVRIEEESEMQCQDGFDDFEVARRDLFPGEVHEERPENVDEAANEVLKNFDDLKDSESGGTGEEQTGGSDSETQEPGCENDDCEQGEVNQAGEVNLDDCEQGEVNQVREESLDDCEQGEANQVENLDHRQENLKDCEQGEVKQVEQENLEDCEQREVDQVRQENLADGGNQEDFEQVKQENSADGENQDLVKAEAEDGSVQDAVVGLELQTGGNNEDRLTRSRSEEVSHKQDTIIRRKARRESREQPMPQIPTRSRKLNFRRKLVPATKFDEDGWLCPSAHKEKRPKQGFIDGWLIRERITSKCDG